LFSGGAHLFAEREFLHTGRRDFTPRERGMMKLGTFTKLFPAALLIFAFSLSGVAALAEDQPASEVVAEVAGQKITLGDLEGHSTDNMNRARSQLVQAHIAMYQAERSALDQEIDKRILSEAAAREHLTGDELLKREATKRVKDPTEETIKIFYLASGQKDPYDVVRPKIISSIRSLEEKQAADNYVAELRAKQEVKVNLLPPRQEVAVGETPAVGPSDAPVTVVEFADYQCPYCRQEEPTVRRLREQFKDRVRVSYRDFPLPMHQNAHKAAEASRCAGEQGAYWPYHDRLFSGSADDLADAGLKSMARQLKLDGSKFDKCLDSSAEAANVDKDFNFGKGLGITGTPTMYINGYTVSGAASFDTLSQLVEQIDASGEKKAASAETKPQAKAAVKASAQTALLN
jgi:protein-disulfide isomerase